MKSKQWLKEHFSDPYVKKAQQEGYLARSAYKLEQIQDKFHIFKKGMSVVDLGAAPGGWSQIIKKHIGDKGFLLAVDCLPLQVSGINFIQGDFTEDQIFNQVCVKIKDADLEFIDVVVSDMAPNLSGQSSIDQPKSLYLAEIALDFAQKMLKYKGVFIVKIFEGAGVQQYIGLVKTQFKTVKIFKPKASRSRSSEMYLICLDFCTD